MKGGISPPQNWRICLEVKNLRHLNDSHLFKGRPLYVTVTQVVFVVLSSGAIEPIKAMGNVQ